MGMLLHHTWVKEQKKKSAPKPKVTEEVKEETNEPSEPVKKTGGRRKSSK